MKKWGKILIPAAALLLVALLLLWQNGVFSPQVKGDAAGTVHLTIRCDNALSSKELNENLRSLLPRDGVMGEAYFVIYEDDTVFTVLTRFCRERKIALESTGSTRYGVYVEGIGGLYERDCGEESGWMFSVDGDFVSKSAGDTPVTDGCEILWTYTLDLGRDVGAHAA